MSGKPDWHIARFLPDLTLPLEGTSGWETPGLRGALGLFTDVAAIAPLHDPRVQEALQGDRVASVLAGRFLDVNGRAVEPCVLILRRDAQLPQTLPMLIDFRNAVAFACVAYARAAVTAGNSNFQNAYWSTRFNFHPAEISKDGRVLVFTPAVTRSLGDPETLVLGTDPRLMASLPLRGADESLARALGKLWVKRYLGKARQGTRRSRAIFRSLELAYLAAQVPGFGSESAMDYGMTIAHWVSAMETLVWPNRGNATEADVWAVLSEALPKDGVLRRRVYSVHKKRVSGPRKLVRIIYQARNDFLHGNALRAKVLELPKNPTTLGVFELPSSIYRMALFQQLGGRARVKPKSKDHEIRTIIQEGKDQSQYVRAMEVALGLREQSRRRFRVGAG